MKNRFEYLYVEFEADRLLKQMIKNGVTRDTDVDWHDRDALDVLAYDRFIDSKWTKEGKVWYVEPRGKELADNGGYEKLNEFLRVQHKNKIYIKAASTLWSILCIVILIILDSWIAFVLWPVGIFGIAWIFTRYEQKKYAVWFKSKTNWHLNKI